MTKRWCRFTLLALGVLAAACSGGNEGPSCSLEGGTQLAAAPWPKFRADTLNSGRSGIDISQNSGTGVQLFPSTAAASPAPAPTAIGAIQTTPILGPDSIFLGSTDGNIYIIDYQGQPVPLEEQPMVGGAITGSPLLGADGTLFVPAADGSLTQFKSDGTEKNQAVLFGPVTSSPNIWTGDGTVYVGTLGTGIFSGVCPNGVPRFSLSTGPTQASAAVTQDPNQPTTSTPIILTAGFGGQVRAYDIRGRQRWSFLASATVDAAVVIDESTDPDQFLVVDTAGRAFAGSVMNGQPNTAFRFAAAASITASPALGRDAASVPTAYFADQGGTLYAVNRATGAVRWTFQADGPISSSPAVATGGADDVIVFAADILTVLPSAPQPVAVSGRVYAVRDDGTEGTLLWTYDTGHSVGASSPSIGADGTVYIGRAGIRLGTTGECPTSDPCVVDDGGALYAIGP